MKKISPILLLLTLFPISAYSQQTKPTDYSQKIKEATPKSLPQTPIVKRQTSDAQDDNLKGKVKLLIEEREGLTGIEKPIGRRTSLFADFDEQGNYLRTVNFEYRGRPYSVTVYGYIDGTRASLSNSIRFGDEWLVGLSGDKKKTDEKLTTDPRYSLKYEYKYTDGKLSEIQLILNTGKKFLSNVYNYKGNQREVLSYTDDGELNSKYLYTFDDKGNDIERTDFNVQQPKVPEKGKFSFKYESFDEKGNWTKRIFLKLEVENGKEIYKPLAIEYRTITYYS